jgi:hypothetical protein
MVTISAVLLGEEAEEEKYIADPNSLVGQVRLGRAGLTESTSSVMKHRVFMAEVLRAHSLFCRPRHRFTQPRQLVGR